MKRGRKHTEEEVNVRLDFVEDLIRTKLSKTGKLVKYIEWSKEKYGEPLHRTQFIKDERGVLQR